MRHVLLSRCIWEEILKHVWDHCGASVPGSIFHNYHQGVSGSFPSTHLLTYCLRASWKHLSCCVCVHARKHLARGTTTDSNHLEFSPVLTPPVHPTQPPSNLPTPTPPISLEITFGRRQAVHLRVSSVSSGAEGSNTDWIRLGLQEGTTSWSDSDALSWLSSAGSNVCVEPMWPKHAQVFKLNPGNINK